MTKEQNDIETGSHNYWNSYYGMRSAPTLPSQFAVFTLGEIPDPCAIVDFGCGSGRDTLYFAEHGIPTVGVDASSIAIENCQKRASEKGLESTRFICSAIEDDNLPGDVSNAVTAIRKETGPVILYARFFLHAINDEAEDKLLKLVTSQTYDSVFACEFRTERDREQTKETTDHYRRFINPLEFITRLNRRGFNVQYFVEGFGYAKYKADDAHIARVVFAKGR